MAVHALAHGHFPRHPFGHRRGHGVFLVAVAGGASRLLGVFQDGDVAEVDQVRLLGVRTPGTVRVLVAFEHRLFGRGGAVMAGFAGGDFRNSLESAVLVIPMAGFASTHAQLGQVCTMRFVIEGNGFVRMVRHGVITGLEGYEIKKKRENEKGEEDKYQCPFHKLSPLIFKILPASSIAEEKSLVILSKAVKNKLPKLCPFKLLPSLKR